MTIVNVIVRWGTQTFSDVSFNLNESLDLFKAQLQSLTDVDPSKQKIMIKGMLLKNDTDLSKLAISQGQTILMMGTPDEKSKTRAENEESTQQSEIKTDAPDITIPCGAINLGNTCYFNASFQCLSNIQELSDSLQQLQPSKQHSPLLIEICKAIKVLRGDHSVLNPSTLIKALRTTFPQFDERSDHGLHSQQDAEECYSQLLSFIKSNLFNGDNIVNDLFGIKISKTTKCDIHKDEQAIIANESATKLTCHISQSTNHLMNGLLESLMEQIEMSCPNSTELSKHTCTSKLSRLPPYLTVHFIRFFWKKVEKVKAKILRRVSFPMMLDVYSLCDDSLQSQLKPVRGNSDPKPTRTAWEGDEKCQVTGYYELVGLLTHAGRSADAGHYIGWIKETQLNNAWWKFDDDTVTQVKDDDILRLDGGGDWHMAYICLYRAIWVPKVTL